jgi:hypothetical protein
MNRITVIEFITLDGVVEDPDGRGGMPGGGWAFRYGPEAVAAPAGPLLLVHERVGHWRSSG